MQARHVRDKSKVYQKVVIALPADDIQLAKKEADRLGMSDNAFWTLKIASPAIDRIREEMKRRDEQCEGK